MKIFQFNPLEDSRWDDFLSRHRSASVFHTRGWLSALRKTYDYEPIAFTTSASTAELRNAIVFCDVRSWITGRRLVSLPFSDHCQPLVEDGEDFNSLMASLAESENTARWKYIELRPLDIDQNAMSQSGFGNSDNFAFHHIDLRPDAEVIYRNFHDSCIRRKIKKAEREGLTYEVGFSKELLAKFESLMLITRRRHKLPPQPSSWFRNVSECLGDHARLHVLSKQDTPVAAILTLQFRDSLVYKYGCSDARFHNLGGMPLLFWKAVQAAKLLGITNFDLGRSSNEDPGLLGFKTHLGGIPSNLCYYRTPIRRPKVDNSGVGRSFLRTAMAKLPDSTFASAGRLLYRHFG